MDRLRSWSWLWVGALIAALPAYIAPLAGGAGWAVTLTAGALAVVLVVVGWWVWRREQPKRPSPRSEYLVVVYLGMYYGTALLVLDPGDRLLDWMIFLAPVSFLPLATRLLLADDGSVSNRARRIARKLHLVLSTALSIYAVVMALTVWLLAVMPLVAIPAVFHLVAARFYRQTFRLVPS